MKIQAQTNRNTNFGAVKVTPKQAKSLGVAHVGEYADKLLKATPKKGGYPTEVITKFIARLKNETAILNEAERAEFRTSMLEGNDIQTTGVLAGFLKRAKTVPEKTINETIEQKKSLQKAVSDSTGAAKKDAREKLQNFHFNVASILEAQAK